MGVLGVAAAAGLVLAGCYSPSLRDCTISCSSAGDCAAGQLCGADGMCASPEVAGHCAMVDAGRADAALHDAAPRDAGPDASPDAGRTVRLTVQIMGRGSVTVEGAGSCSSQDPDKGNCMYDVVPGVPVTAQAMPITASDVFTMWSSLVCAGQGARCTFTPVVPTMITARFGRSDMRSAL